MTFYKEFKTYFIFYRKIKLTQVSFAALKKNTRVTPIELESIKNIKKTCCYIIKLKKHMNAIHTTEALVYKNMATPIIRSSKTNINPDINNNKQSIKIYSNYTELQAVQKELKNTLAYLNFITDNSLTRPITTNTLLFTLDKQIGICHIRIAYYFRTI